MITVPELIKYLQDINEKYPDSEIVVTAPFLFSHLEYKIEFVEIKQRLTDVGRKNLVYFVAGYKEPAKKEPKKAGLELVKNESDT
jgi:hypothetical protein